MVTNCIGEIEMSQEVNVQNQVFAKYQTLADYEQDKVSLPPHAVVFIEEDPDVISVVQNPGTSADDVMSQDAVTKEFDKKLNKSNSAGSVYLVNLSGTQENRPYNSSGTTADSIVARTNTGTIRTQNPTNVLDCVNLQYLNSKLSGVKKWVTTYGFNGTGINGWTTYQSSTYLGGNVANGTKFRVVLSDSRNGRTETAIFHVQRTYDATHIGMDMNVISGTPRIRQTRLWVHSDGNSFIFETRTCVVSSVGNTDWHNDSNLRIKMIEKEVSI